MKKLIKTFEDIFKENTLKEKINKTQFNDIYAHTETTAMLIIDKLINEKKIGNEISAFGFISYLPPCIECRKE